MYPKDTFLQLPDVFMHLEICVFFSPSINSFNSENAA